MQTHTHTDTHTDTHTHTHINALLTTFGRFRYFASTELGSTLSPMM